MAIMATVITTTILTATAMEMATATGAVMVTIGIIAGAIMMRKITNTLVSFQLHSIIDSNHVKH